MALHALRDSFLDARPLEAGPQALPFESWRPAQGLDAPSAAPQSQLHVLAIAAGLGALALLSPMVLGSAALRPDAAAAFLLIAAVSLVAAGASCQRAFNRASAAEQALAAHRAAVETAGGVAPRWQLLGGHLAWDGDAARVLSLSPAKLPYNFRDFRPYLHQDNRLNQAISIAFRTARRSVNWPIRLEDGEGGWRPFHIRGSVERDRAPGCQVFTGLVPPADGATSTGEDAAARLTGLLESLPISVAIWDRENRLSLCNRKFRQLYRIAEASALNGASFEDVQAEAGAPIAQHPPEVRGLAGRFQFQDRQLPQGGWLRIGEYWSGDGTLVSFGMNVTASKLSQRRVLEREQEMRAKVDGYEQSRRQLEIQARQLRELAESYNEEKIRAEAANQAKSEFLANVSHELRTPLNAIIGFSEMMRDGVLGPIGNPKYESYVKDIYASGRYLLEMINDILDMSKIEAGRMTLSPEWVMLGPLFEECLSVVHPSAIEGKVELVRSGNSGMSVFADKRAMKQVLINLLANAVKFTLPGGKVVLRVYRYRNSLRIAIADTGVGIAKHDLGRLGRPFEQVGNQLTKGHKGTGLGLAISRSLVEMHGGKLDIKSKVGEGTTVTCILPVRDDKEAGQKAA